ncbi:MAG: D-Ala-D-Ala carboxypeptidase family metallohydrolase [Candidatus Hydromicrobium sp.]|nr:D-Ala-D-Ala carboxypeptidase family metallohydrolase [Candidatus Hydromicrobium sp.]
MTSEQILNKAIEIEIELAKLSPAQRRSFQVTKNFKWYECYSGDLVNGQEIPKHIEPPRQYWINAITHFLNMQLVADYLAVKYKKYVPIEYTSLYRTPFWNIHGGGSTNSYHMSAKAGDSRPLHIIISMYDYALIIAKLCPDMNGFKRYGTFVHADMQNNFMIYK